MKELADLQPKQIKAKLYPLVTAYREWIDQQEATIQKDKEARKDFDDAPPRPSRSAARTSPASRPG